MTGLLNFLRVSAQGRRLLSLAVTSTLLRWCLVLAFSLPLLAPLLGSNLLAADNYDESLFSHGASNLFTLIVSRSSRYSQYQTWYVLLLALLVAIKILFSAASFDVLVAERSLGCRANRLGTLRLLPAFTALLVFAVTCGALMAAVFLAILPTVGSLLLPLLGERGTDLAQLTLLLMVCAVGWLGLVFFDLVRVQVATAEPRLASAFAVAMHAMRHHFVRILATALVLRPSAVVILAAGLYGAQRCQLTLPGTTATRLVVVCVEAATLASLLLYFCWVLCIKRLLAERAHLDTQRSDRSELDEP